MLQSGMRAPMGVKVRGPDLETIERVGVEIEKLLKEVPAVDPGTVQADRIVGKPYIEIDIDRDAAARYGLHMADVQNVIETAVGGRRVTTTVEGRERYPVRVRYARELRDRMDALGDAAVATPGGAQVPLRELAEIRYVRGPQAIKSEDTALTGYVTFGSRPGYAEVDVVEMCAAYLDDIRAAGRFDVPDRVSYRFAGSYENQIRAQKKLSVVLPLALLIIFMILYMQFRSVSTTLIVFSGIAVVWAGGFILVWLYGKPWFLDFSLMGASMRDLFQIHPVNLPANRYTCGGFVCRQGTARFRGVPCRMTACSPHGAARAPAGERCDTKGEIRPRREVRSRHWLSTQQGGWNEGVARSSHEHRRGSTSKRPLRISSPTPSSARLTAAARERPSRAPTTSCSSRSAIRESGYRWRSSPRCSTSSTAPRTRARSSGTAPASGSPWRSRLSRDTEAGSGSRAKKGAEQGSLSRCLAGPQLTGCGFRRRAPRACGRPRCRDTSRLTSVSGLNIIKVRLPAVQRCTGRGAARLARLLWEQEVGGSNPLAPTIILTGWFSWSSILPADFFFPFRPEQAQHPLTGIPDKADYFFCRIPCPL